MWATTVLASGPFYLRGLWSLGPSRAFPKRPERRSFRGGFVGGCGSCCLRHLGVPLLHRRRCLRRRRRRLCIEDREHRARRRVRWEFSSIGSGGGWAEPGQVRVPLRERKGMVEKEEDSLPPSRPATKRRMKRWRHRQRGLHCRWWGGAWVWVSESEREGVCVCMCGSNSHASASKARRETLNLRRSETRPVVRDPRTQVFLDVHGTPVRQVAISSPPSPAVVLFPAFFLPLSATDGHQHQNDPRGSSRRGETSGSVSQTLWCKGSYGTPRRSTWRRNPPPLLSPFEPIFVNTVTLSFAPRLQVLMIFPSPHLSESHFFHVIYLQVPITPDPSTYLPD